MKLPSLFKTSSSETSSSPWPWQLPACSNNPKTLSFRAQNHHNNIFKTLNSTYENTPLDYFLETSFSITTTTTSTISDDDVDEALDVSNIETLIRGLRSEKERLFFEPEETSSILVVPHKNIDEEEEEVVDVVVVPFKESVVMAMDSRDPFVDFRDSMEEMVKAYNNNNTNGVDDDDHHHHQDYDWEVLEELLSCYLKVNVKSNHGYIVGAFVDLLVSLASSHHDDDDHNNGVSSSSSSSSPSSSATITISSSDQDQCSSSTTTTTTSHSFTSPLSFYSSSATSSSTSPCLSLLEADDEDEIMLKKH